MGLSLGVVKVNKYVHDYLVSYEYWTKNKQGKGCINITQSKKWSKESAFQVSDYIKDKHGFKNVVINSLFYIGKRKELEHE